MAMFALCWLAALVVVYSLTVSWIRAGKRQAETLLVPVRVESKDADPRRRRQL